MAEDIGLDLDPDLAHKFPRLLQLVRSLSSMLPGRRTDLPCPDCGSMLTLKSGKHGLFYGCSRWEETSCRGSVAALDDGSPVGTPVDARTRALRKEAYKLLVPRVAFAPPEDRDPFDDEAVSESRRWFLDWCSQEAIPQARWSLGSFTAEECVRLIAALRHAHGTWTRMSRVLERDTL
jgi:ssDNA-binding Zn-finger/Zn-ribbon topoisomerase 1